MSGRLGQPETYTVVAHWRGGAQTYAALDGVSKVVWERRGGDVASAEITIAKRDAGAGCCGALASIEPWAHEITIYRDGSLVWQGPLVDIVEDRTTVTLTARDVTGWLDKRALRKDITGSTQPWGKDGADLILVMAWILLDALWREGERQDLNIIPWVTILGWTGITYRIGDGTDSTGETWRWAEVNMGDQFRSIAALGAEWTVVGRRILMGPEPSTDTRPLVRLTDADFLADLEVNVAGLDTATWAYVEGGTRKNAQIAERISYGRHGVDATNRLEVLLKGSNWTDHGVLKRLATTYLTAARPSLVVVKVPDQATLAATAPVRIEELVPGTRFDLAITGEAYCRHPSTGFNLSQVQVTWEEHKGEQVAVSFLPLRDQSLETDMGEDTLT
ncbi:MAG: hypothetical protein J2P26_06095 [Nocardiopsaceae bacterium]|nr:hypothetical protein [Nocardiopsaceae bacterium]